MKRISVSATGHRILTDVEKIVQGLNIAVVTIKESYAGAPLTVISSLAEGADRLIAEAVLRLNDSELIAAVPFAMSDYITDFGPEGSASRIHFESLLAQAAKVIELPGGTTREESYEIAGYYNIDNSDVLLAIWDGQGAQGQGGTADIVERARQRNLPTVLVLAGNRKPGTKEPTTLGEEQGRVVLERLSS